ncbi:hypothetical protein Leryth_017331 [Lithospermum erythrorhizon]|nr:hypothetical protein Leryth_017331 [Lithospermum erythrorhizon]
MKIGLSIHLRLIHFTNVITLIILPIRIVAMLETTEILKITNVEDCGVEVICKGQLIFFTCPQEHYFDCPMLKFEIFGIWFAPHPLGTNQAQGIELSSWKRFLGMKLTSMI